MRGGLVNPEHQNPYAAGILDSGDRTEFETGAVRDMRAGKGRCDLMPLDVLYWYFRKVGLEDRIINDIKVFLCDPAKDTKSLYFALQQFCHDAYNDCAPTMFLEVAKHFEEGAVKYGENNWQKGIPPHIYIDSALRHYMKWLRKDTDEPHDRAFVWNIMCCIWEVEFHKEATECEK